jgi:hypothetical protein
VPAALKRDESESVRGGNMDRTKSMTFTEAVLLRPRMYTLGGSYEEVVAFLEGYHSGMAKYDPYAVPVSEWASFRDWLREQMRADSTDVFARFKDQEGNGSSPLASLLEWFSRFHQEGASVK